MNLVAQIILDWGHFQFLGVPGLTLSFIEDGGKFDPF